MPQCSLQSSTSNLLSIPKTKTVSYGNRSFSVIPRGGGGGEGGVTKHLMTGPEGNSEIRGKQN